MTRKNPESIDRTIIKHAIQNVGASCHVYHASAESEIGHSDLYGTLDGRAFYFEVKTPRWKPRSEADKVRVVRQKIFMNREKGHGARVGFVHTPEEALALLMDKCVDKSLDKETVDEVGFSL